MATKTGHKLSNRKLTLTLLVSLLAVVLIAVIVFGAVQFAQGAGEPYNHITAELKADKTVYGDYTATTIKNALNVVGYANENDEGGFTLGADDYDVSFSHGGDVLGAEACDIIVTSKGADGKTYTVLSTDYTVTPAEITANVIVPDYTLKGNYYVDGQGYDAFVQGMTKAEVQQRLAVELVSSNPDTPKVIKTFADGVTWTDETAVPNVFGDAGSTTNLAVDISLTYTYGDTGVYTANATINFNTLHEFALALGQNGGISWQQPSGLSSKTTVDSLLTTLQGYVYIAYNNGALSHDPINIRESLLNTGIIGITAQSLINGSEGHKYDKVIEIPHRTNTDIKPLVLSLTGIKYDNPDEVLNIIQSDSYTGTIARPKYLMRDQEARSEELDYGGLFISAYYGDKESKIYVTDLLANGKAVSNLKYFVNDTVSAVLTKQVNKITFNLDSYSFSGGVFVSSIAATRPTMTFDKETVDFSETLSTKMEGLVTDDALGDNMVLTPPSGVTLQDDGSYKFSQGGVYIFKVTFAKGDDSDFYWAANGGGALTADNKTVEYVITVTGAELDLELNNFPQNIQYGNGEPNFNLVGTVEGSPSMGMTGLSDRIKADTPVFDDDNPNMSLKTAPRYRVVYTGTYISVGKDGTETTVEYTDKYNFPTERGEYTVTIETEPTSYYKKASVAKDFKIEQRQISLDSVSIPSQVFDKTKSYNIPDADGNFTAGAGVINLFDSGITVNGLASSDTVSTVMRASWADNDTSNRIHKGDYTIEFVIKNRNYKWTDDSASKTAQFSITARQLSYDLSQSGMTYGEDLPAASVTNDSSLNGYVTLKAVYKDSKGNVIADIPNFANGELWQAGTYTVEYSVDGYETGVTSADVICPVKTASFTVEQKSITDLAFNGSGGTYSGSDYTFTVGGWNADGTSMGILASDITVDGAADVSKVLTITAEGKLLTDNTTAVTTNIAIDYNSGKITVRDAGTYKFAVNIVNGNYKWAAAYNVDKTVIIDQAEYVVVWKEDVSAPSFGDWTGKTISYFYDNLAHYPLIQALQDDALTLTAEFYTDENCTKAINKEDIVASGTYYVKITNAEGKPFVAADGETLPAYSQIVNYKAPDSSKLKNSFTIASAGLDKPQLDSALDGVSGSNVTVVYNGKNVDIETFIENYEEDYLLGTGESVISKLAFTYKVGEDTVTEHKNVKTYTVLVVPTGNFEWKNGADEESKREAVSFTIQITPRVVEILWTNLSTVYGTAATTETEILNKCDGDNVQADIAYYAGKGQTSGTVVEPGNAGFYTAFADVLKNNAEGNYTLNGHKDYITVSGNNQLVATVDYIVEKQSVKHTDKAVFDGQFNGSVQNEIFNGFNKIINGVVTATLSGIIPKEWFDVKDRDKTLTLGTDSLFDVSTGTFTYFNAGVYSVSFEITDKTNYYWDNTDNSKDFDNNGVYTYSWDNFASVSRMEISSPKLGSSRAMEKEKSITDLSTILTRSLANGVTYSVMYGLYNVDGNDYGNADSSTQVGGGFDGTTAEIGQYFALLQMDAEFAFNYVWKVDYDNSDNTGYYGDGYILPKHEGEGVYRLVYTREHGSAVYLRYAITASQLNVDFVIGSFDGVTHGYMFGANGYALGDNVIADPLSREKFITLGGDDKNIIINNGDGITIEYTFTRTDNGIDTLTDTDLVNSLPWFYGSYSVKIDVKFVREDLHQQYQDLSFNKTFTVTQRPVEVIWDLDGAAATDNGIVTTYNGTERNVKATVTNMPKKDAADLTAAPTVSVKYLVGSNIVTPVNAKEYTVKIDAISGCSDMTVNDTQVCTLTINKLDVSIVANGNADDKHIYGDYDKKLSWDYANGSNRFYQNTDGVDHSKGIVIQLLKDSHNYASSLAPVGEYTVKLVWSAAAAEYKDNYNLTVENATYYIVPRPITVTFNSGLTAVYGTDTFNLYDGIASVLPDSSCGAVDAAGNIKALVGGSTNQSVFDLSAKLTVDGTTYVLAQYSPVGGYTITGTEIDGNYSVTFVNAAGDGTTGLYTVGNADIEDIDIGVYGGIYNGKDNNLLAEYTAKTVNGGAAPDRIIWEYSKTNDGNWTAYISDGKEFTVKNVADSGKYYIRISADNHNPEVVEVTCKISKKDVTITPSMSVMFGEKDPTSAGADGGCYNAELQYLINPEGSNIRYGIDGLVNGESINNIGLNGTFSYATNYVQGTSGVNDSCALTFNVGTLNSPNYNFIGGVGVLTVTKLPFNVIINDKSDYYGESELNNDGTLRVPLDYSGVMLPDSTYTGEQLTLDDLEIGAYDDIFVLSTTAYQNGITNSVGKYDIICSAKTGMDVNYDVDYSKGTFEIKQAANTISGFAFENGYQYTSVNGITNAAWTYGPYSASSHLLGYNANGDQRITEPTARFNEDAAIKFAVNLYYGQTLKNEQPFTSVKELFDALNASTFGAGIYRIEVTLEGTANYGDVTAEWYFEVDKKEITFKAEDITLTYGDGVPAEFKYNAVGLVNGDTTEAILADYLVEGKLPAYFGTLYKAGSTAAVTYGITYNNTTVPALDNYVVAANGFVDGTITVNKRVVTITIDNKENTYNLQHLDELGNVVPEAAKTLTFKIVGNTLFYNVNAPQNGEYNNDNQKIIVLVTEALTGKNGIKTNDVVIVNGQVSGYAIYARFVGDCGNDYVIEFSDCSFDSDSDNAITQDGKHNAGLYKINQGNLSINDEGVWYNDGNADNKNEKRLYTGVANFYKASVEGDSSLEITFTYSKLVGGKWQAWDQANIIGVGTYKATARCTSNNYTAGTTNYEFTISQATLTLTANTGAWVHFGTDLSSGTLGAGNRFSGFGYTAYSDIIVESVYLNYLADNQVKFITPGYGVNTAAESANCFIEPQCAGNDNIKIETNRAPLEIRKRTVSVTILGYDNGNGEYSWCYYKGVNSLTNAELVSKFNSNIESFIQLNDNDTFGASGNRRGNLGVSLALPGNAINYHEDGYQLQLTLDDCNYDVTVTNADNMPTFMIKKAPLTLYANNVTGNVPNAYGFIYGTVIIDENGKAVSGITLNYEVKGLQNNESITELLVKNNQTISFSIKGGDGSDYQAWKSGVGNYSVSIDKLNDFENYDLSIADNYKSANLVINPRPINVSTVNQEFDWDGTDYHGGKWGKAHNAELTFSDVNSIAVDLNNNINKIYRPKYANLVYNTKASEGQTAGKAPTKVGEYSVTVTLTDTNYVFANSAKSFTIQNYKITQKVIFEDNLGWYKTSIREVDGEDFDGFNSINNYINDIMEVVMFTFMPSGESGSKVIDLGNAETENTYYFDGQRLSINANGRGKYEVRFKLRSSATANYVFNSSNDTYIVSSFIITASKITMTLTVEDWTYSETPNSPVVKINGTPDNNVKLSYARVTETDLDIIGSFYGKEFSSIDSLKIGAFSPIGSITFNAGYYVVRAEYSGTYVNDDGETVEVNERLYFVFRIDTFKVAVPQETVGGYVFNGGEQSLSIEFDSRYVRAEYEGHAGTSSSGIIVYATDADTYTVKFTLIDTDNYEWVGGGTQEHTLLWTIGVDNAINGVITVESDGYEATYSKVENAIARDTVTVKDGYDGYLSMSWAKDEGQRPESITGWNNGLPSNVGGYFIKFTLTNNGKNYTDKIAYGKLHIDPLEIKAVASGSIIYGDGWNTAKLSYKVEGLQFGDRYEADENVRIMLADENYGVLQAGQEYYVVLDSVDGIAKGLDAGANYIIKAEAGLLEVKQRDITINIGNFTSQYGIEIDLNKVDVIDVDKKLIAGDSLNLNLYTNINDGDGIGGYIINATYNNGNYNVTVNPGTYTVTERRIRIELDVRNGIYKDLEAKVVIKSVFDDSDNNVNIKDWVEQQGLVLSINYRGTINKDNAAYDSDKIPTQAGSYTAMVRGTNNRNFIIVGEPFVSFVVSKKEVDGSLIKIANQTYTGKALTPVLDSGEFIAEYGDGIYEVLDYSEFINAKTHTVRLQIKDFDNYKWKSVEIAEREISFTIDKADNALTSDIVIAGWAYGDYSIANNLPVATVKFGQSEIIFMYSNSRDGVYVSGAPETGIVGEYWVKVAVPATDNYNVFSSSPVKFNITKKALVKPTLTIINEGEGQNNVYTGKQLTAAIVGYDMSRMNLTYDDINVSGGQIIARATDAGTYTIKLSIADAHNYCWQGTDDNEIALIWVISPKAIAKPTANTDRFMVNGQILTYIPEGFDEETMTISGNQTAYGGEFKVTVGLKDTANYVWAEGGTDDFTFDWQVIGINTVFYIISGVLGGASVAALTFVGVQFLLDRRRKRLIDLAIDARSKADAYAANNKGGKK